MSDSIDPKSGLTPDEETVMSHLVNAWNAWLGIDACITQDEMDQFRKAIHQAQEVLAGRVVRRTYPKYWR